MKLPVAISKQDIYYLIPIILILGIGIFLLIQKPWQSENGQVKSEEIKQVAYQSAEYGFKVKYPEGMVEGKIPEEQQKKDPIILKLVQVDPPLLVTIWQEQGLGILDMYVKKPLLEYLKGNVDRRYGAEYNDFKKEKLEDTKLAGLDAFTVWFTFQNKEKTYREKIKLAVTVKDKTAYYLQCMAPAEVWDTVEPSCDIIKDSFEFVEKQN